MTGLVKRARDGDAEAFIGLMDSHRQLLCKVARGFLREQMDIDDAVADTVLACWESIGELESPAYFRTWLVRILINKCHDILRRSRRTVPLESIAESREADSGFARTEFECLVDSLDEQYRAIFILYYSEGFKIREISSILGIPPGTVGSRLQRGRDQLRHTFEEKGKNRNEY